jgi:cytochrome c oxidase assembly protein subunit 15
MMETTASKTTGAAERGSLLALGFGTTVGMWAVGYVCRQPPVLVPAWTLLFLMLACLVAGGFFAGRLTSKGWSFGLRVGLLASALNLLILGSILSGEEPNRMVPTALAWVPGSLALGAALGALGAVMGTRVRGGRTAGPVHWTGAFTKVAAAATFLLLVAGGLVTSKDAGLAVVDWPNTYGYNMLLYPLSRMTGGIYYEHAHRLFGTLVGLTTLVMLVHLYRVRERSGVRRLAVLAFLMVVLQGVLGGLRVTGRFTLAAEAGAMAPSVTMAVIHGITGQLFLGLMVAVAVLTSRTWTGPAQAEVRGTAGGDRLLTLVLLGLLVVQVALGAVLRHLSQGLLVHITVAAILVGVAVVAGARLWGLYPGRPVLPRLGKWLLVVVLVQVGLGIASLPAVTRNRESLLPGAPPPNPPALEVIFTTAHQAVGAGLVALVVAGALFTRRLLEPAKKP